jgi:hypothetical protein
MNENRVADSIKKMVIGAIIAEYGALEIKDEAKYELRHRVNGLIRSSNSVQDYFRHRPEIDPATREVFKKNFLKDEYLLISEILVAIWNFDEKSLEDLLQQIKNNTEEGLDTDVSEVEEMPDAPEVAPFFVSGTMEEYDKFGAPLFDLPEPSKVFSRIRDTDPSQFPLDEVINLEKLQAYADSLSAERPASSAPVCTCEELSKNRAICPVCDKEEYEKAHSALNEARQSNTNQNY